LGSAVASATDAPSAAQIRARALRHVGFLSVTTAFALVLFAQVGFIVHLIAFLDPVVGRASATTAIALLTAMAVVGRVLFSTVIDRLNQRLASALSFVSQAAALLILINFRNEHLLIAACAVFGFSVGNLITLPSLIVQREFPGSAFGMVLGLSTAIGTFAGALGPGLIGLIRDVAGNYGPALLVCMALKIAGGSFVLMRKR
jgi:predicted MFS family arabinose efflux permease